MEHCGLRLGSSVGPFVGCIDAALLRAFATATADRSPRVRDGSVVPAAAMVTQLWEAQEAGRAALVPSEFQAAATGGVHGEHDLVLHRPVEPGEPLRTWVEGVGTRPAGSNSLVVLSYRTFDVHGELVAEQWWTTVWLGAGCERSGEPAPDHVFPDAARERPLGSWHTVVDDDMARRYAQVSGDWSAHHFDEEAARRSGAEGPFLHGLCAMALCAQGLVELVAEGDPERLARVAVRFAKPVLVGEGLDVQLYDAGPLGFAFEARSGGAEVITQGRAELR